ncbi:MAG: putative multidrug resistance ABC transporter ATP-binding/permease protein YheH [candidate division BRC1 bacterium ADurb.BinA292]|nr:MAG: putative multidrug resistance ABC transporter ATP-binding/permease protein YheH [candidate division BRC1 bacterium ADurb.BinA292]
MSKLKQALAPDEALAYRRRIDTRLLGRLWEFVRPYQRIVGFTVLLSLAANALRVLQPLVGMYIIDHQISEGDVNGLILMVLLFIGLLLLASACDVAFTWFISWVGQRAMDTMRRRLIRHIFAQDTVFFDRNPVGRLITRLTSDVETLNELFASGLVAVMGELLIIIGVIALMLTQSAKLTGVVLLSAPFILAVAIFFRRHSRKWYLETRRALATMNAYLQENVAGMRTVQAFNRQRRNHRQFASLNNEYRVANLHTILAFALFFPAMSFISSMAVAAVIWVGGRDMIAGRGAAAGLSFGQLFFFVQCVHMLFAPVRSLSEKYNLLQAAMASSERIFKLFDQRPTIDAPREPAPIRPLTDAIRFEDVRFAYVPDEPVLKGISFEIRRGQSVAVVGATGAGKTTLINLLTRFYDVTSGRITYDGVDLRRFDPRALRRQFAVVLQEVFLFSGTIADNLRLANPELTEEEMWEVLRQVRAEDFVASLAGGLHAEVSERGGTFSTGQKQLLAFARALASDPQLLILDEATANIDTETEQRIQEAIGTVLAGRTALVIAHRLSTIQRADRILVMHHGQIHEAGTHAELLAIDGLYRRLYELQYRHEAVADGGDPAAPAAAEQLTNESQAL